MHAPVTLFEAYAILWNTASWSQRNALVQSDGLKSLTYGALHREISEMAGRLREAGVEPRARVGISMERSVENVVVILSLMAAGACPCPLEPRLTATELNARLQLAGVRTVVADSPNLAGLRDCEAARVLAIDDLPEAKAFWSTDIQPDDPALLLFTSGSTGRPKGVLLSHKGLLNNAKGVIEATGLLSTDTLLHVMPLYHTNGLNNQILSPLMTGSQIILAPRFRASDMPKLIEEHRPTIITGVPTMYSRMLDHSFTPESLASLRFARCGSAPITRELHLRIEAHLNTPLVVSYGLSEATCTSTMNPPERHKIGSIGKALPFQNIHLRDHDGSVIATPHKEGEICIEGDNLMLGYLGTQGDGILEPASSVIHSGDLGHVDEEGYFYITGRLKDVIIRGGENISPSIIEQTLSANPAVRSCCVVGRPDTDLGEVPVAFVVPVNPDFQDKCALQALVSEKLSRTHRLEDVYFVESLPENSVGKVDRKALARSFSAVA